MPYLDGCITYDMGVLASPLRPLECNLQRFYFPECKAYELDRYRADPTYRKRFWNAVGSFGGYYPQAMYQILRENAEVFASRDCEPLVPTLTPRIYANRFRSPETTIYTLYNATGYSAVAPTVCIQRKPGQHVVELLGGEEVECVAVDGGLAARLFLARQDVACVACLPERIQMKRVGPDREVRVSTPPKGARLVVCDKDGKPLTECAVDSEPIALRPSEMPRGAAPLCVKLFDGPRLLDLRGWEP